MRVLVLGGLGMQGSIIVDKMLELGPLNQIDIADSTYREVPTGVHNYIRTDLSDYDTLVTLMDECDLAVCALPSNLGYDCVRAAVNTSTNIVDLSFASEDLSVFDQQAQDNGIAVIHDAGIAPGLSNLIAGRAMLGNPNSIDIIVGGVAQDEFEPFGYTITWSLDDLMEEYTRPARVLVNGEIKEVPALSGVEPISGLLQGEDAGFEIFYTDGLRSLIINNGGVPNLTERTLRWPGHVEKIGPFLNKGSDYLKNAIEEKCKVLAPDLLVMRITSDFGATTMVTRSDENMSAMSRTTALSCFTFASLITSGTLSRTGVLPPEKLAVDDDTYKYVLDKMAEYGVNFSTRYPFM